MEIKQCTEIFSGVSMKIFHFGNAVRGMNQRYSVQLDKCLIFKSIRGDKNDCTLYKIAPRNAINLDIYPVVAP